MVKALICAAKNGKKVTVVIELLARFDEASNINWSKRMQDAGTVSYTHLDVYKRQVIHGNRVDGLPYASMT